MKIVAIVQARMNSTRLPRKVLMKLGNKTVLSHCIERLKKVTLIDEIVIATTTNKADEVIVAEAIKLNVSYYRGSEENVLSRYYEAAKQAKADVIVRITSDCPIVDPDLTNEVIQYFIDQNVDYVSNSYIRTFPRGLDTEVFSMMALEEAYTLADSPIQFEHVTPFIYQNPQMFRLAFYTHETDYSHHRWTLDTEEDYQLLQEIMNYFQADEYVFDWKRVIGFIDQNPYLLQLNAHIEQKKLGE
ncbi:cytidylyltransferase domain-containing protein [Paenibacillus sp. L3-i20]|uniref:cytidylyltransferase domain-containing protein n=1 Tax=Paenibacillus sp. L3-i20 TaxID=2905833 RepID=UPI001EE01AC2|nr:glycosyltransferase family protein [Paenibacillus sp. L3-i20]GKU76810.1 hypothetical protein L3i20_v212070 [Paenibacillus sp. L3-i20]